MAFEAFDDVANPFMPFGIVPDAAPGAPALLLANPTSAALLAAARDAVDQNYTLHPVGSDTPATLRDRIATVFAQQFSDKWQGPISASAVGDSSDFAQIVSFVSPLSERKSRSVLAMNTDTRNAVLLGVGVFAAGLLIYWLTRPKKFKAKRRN